MDGIPDQGIQDDAQHNKKLSKNDYGFDMLDLEIALDKLQNNKAPGPGHDKISVEMIRCAAPNSIQWLYRVFKKKM